MDIVPTVLALSGLPRAADMPGRALAEVLDLPIPGPLVATYEGAGGTRARRSAGRRRRPADHGAPQEPGIRGRRAARQRSAIVGAAGDPTTRSPQGERNLAGLMFEQGRHAEALAAYERLVKLEPEDATLRTSMAGALGALGRYDEAMKQLDAAIRLDPLNVEAYHNRGVVFERRNDPQGGHRGVPPRRALQPAVRAVAQGPPAADRDVGRESAAHRGREEGVGAGPGGQPGRAPRRLRARDEAPRRSGALAPRYVMVHQYRSNVAYLAGDPRQAIAALEKALAIEPDNALFKDNLERLKRTSVRVVPRFDRADVESAALGVGVFVLYAVGACRTIYVGDSGELVAAVYTLGIPHPSGYPLYVLLGKLWTLAVPIGSIAFRMSLFSAACAAARSRCSTVWPFGSASAAWPPPPRPCCSPSARASGARPTSSASTR